ncbi:hemerythrin domain-containing protein [Streptomyces sp. NPDC044571]|uniref:hemerythrin domain-containing protein n=1 Tax=Streptomyces sp. NPDC044571 TaxID=3155371 RepID=UPI003403601C
MGHGGGDVIAELVADHREAAEMFDRIEHTAVAADRQTAVERLTIELVRHTVVEEEHLCPAIREHLPDGDVVADKEIADHSLVEKLVKDLEGLDAEGPEFDRLLAALKSEVTAHVRDEEENLFPRLRRACPQGVLDALGDEARRAKDLASTGALPDVLRTPPADGLSAPGAGLADRVRDIVTGRGR